LQRFGVFEGVVRHVGPFEQRFVDFGLRVGGQLDEFAQQMERIFEMNVVRNVEACQMSANDFLVKGFSVVGDPDFAFTERVRAPYCLFRCGEILNDGGNPFGLLCGGQTSHGGVEVTFFREQFGPEADGVDGMLSERVEGLHGRFVAHGIDHALERVAPVHHPDFQELGIFAFVAPFEKTRFGIVEEHL